MPMTDTNAKADLTLTSGNNSSLGGVRQHSHVHGDQRDDGDSHERQPNNVEPVSWSSLPRKDQLLVLTLARLSEPLTQTSLGSYLFYQLQSFDPSLPDSTISYQAGVINAAFPAAQFLTAMLWGQIADAEYGGRKRVLYIGLLGTMLSIIGFGFSHSFPMAVAFRCLGGVLNGNIGVMRTMISEIIKEKKFQSRAFLILPITFNIGVIIGPILGTSPD
jgi:MFS family permease